MDVTDRAGRSVREDQGFRPGLRTNAPSGAKSQRPTAAELRVLNRKAATTAPTITTPGGLKEEEAWAMEPVSLTCERQDARSRAGGCGDNCPCGQPGCRALQPMAQMPFQPFGRSFPKGPDGPTPV